MSTNTSRLKTRIWNKEIFENDKINFEEATTLDNDNNQTAKSILIRDLGTILN